MSVETVTGFILDCFQQEAHGRTTVYAMGRLADGRTFGLVDTRTTPCFAIRAQDKLRVGSLPEQHTCTIGPSELVSIDGDELLIMKESDILGVIEK